VRVIALSACRSLSHLCLLALSLQVNLGAVRNVLIWGNHSKTMVPDLSHGVVVVENKEKPLSAAVTVRVLLCRSLSPCVLSLDVIGFAG